MATMVKDMMAAPQPLSCRLAHRALGLSHNTIWRWRMAIIGALPPEPEASLSGIVEADEAHQRESRKGSREWVRHKRDPAIYAAPPRLRWQDYKRCGASSTAPPGAW